MFRINWNCDGGLHVLGPAYRTKPEAMEKVTALETYYPCYRGNLTVSLALSLPVLPRTEEAKAKAIKAADALVASYANV